MQVMLESEQRANKSIQVLLYGTNKITVAEDIKHSQKEERFYVLGRTDEDRRLFIAFTIRKKQIRIISSRDMNKKEREIYEKYKKEKNSKI